MLSLSIANNRSHRSRSSRIAAILSSITCHEPKFSNSNRVELLFQGITLDPSLETLSLANRAAANEEESVSTNLVSSVKRIFNPCLFNLFDLAIVFTQHTNFLSRTSRCTQICGSSLIENCIKTEESIAVRGVYVSKVAVADHRSQSTSLRSQNSALRSQNSVLRSQLANRTSKCDLG